MYRWRTLENTPEEAKEWVEDMMSSYHDLVAKLFCEEYYGGGSAECDSVQFYDEEPRRELPRTFYTSFDEVLLQYY